MQQDEPGEARAPGRGRQHARLAETVHRMRSGMLDSEAEPGSEDFGALLRRFRMNAGLGQEALAERARLSVNAISALERGVRRAPHRDTVSLLVAALGLEGAERRALEDAANAAREPGKPRARVETRSVVAASPALSAFSNNLPRHLTSLVGRDDVIAEICKHIEASPLVTLIGTGGVGKTRCALEVGTRLLDGAADGVWLADLAPIAEPDLVAGVIGRALNIFELPGHPLIETLVRSLKSKRLLLIVDNCEHVIEEARSVIATIARGCPAVRILATSREALGIVGEYVYRVPSLSLAGAVQLFADRAVCVDHSFVLHADNAPFVAEIGRRVDGIPFAIELAAARVNLLAPRQLVQKLDELLRVLTGGDRSALPRQHTMRALIDWSYDLLAEDERLLFRKLSVFAGSFTLENAAAVCSDAGWDEFTVLDALSSLVDKSLLEVQPAERGSRFRLLESTRAYARERLAAHGEYPPTARAHALEFAALAQRLERAHDTAPDRIWLEDVRSEMENWRAALTWSVANDIELAQRMAVALRWAYSYIAPAEGRRWAAAMIATVSSGTPAAVSAKLDLAEALFAAVYKDFEAAHAAADRARTKYERLDDLAGLAEAKRRAGTALIYFGRMQAGEELLVAALADARDARMGKLGGLIMMDLGQARQFSGDLDGARTWFTQALGVCRALGAERIAAAVASNFGESEFQAGNADTALQLVRESLEKHRAGNYPLNVAINLANMAAYLVALGRYAEARDIVREAIPAARDPDYGYGIVLLVQRAAAIAALRPASDAAAARVDRLRAARLTGYVDRHMSSIAMSEYTERTERDRTLSALRDVVDQGELARLMAEGEAWSEDDAVSEALLV
jgi:predicted ATPase/transcriptional regulator with XRE-family HTH domain